MDISFSNVSKCFGRGLKAKQALTDVSWDARGGEILGILGPNGAGKSTTLRNLLGILWQDSGSVTVDGGTIQIGSEQFRHLVGYVTEERALYKSSRVIDTIRYFGLLKGLSSRESHSRAEEMLELLDLTAYRKTENRKLSKGLTQRVQLATALVHRPTLLVLDEPLSGLDPVTTNRVRGILANLREQGTTIVLCSHQMREVEAICDRITMLMLGNVVLSGTVDAIRKQHGTGEIFVQGDSQIAGLQSVDSAAPQRDGFLLRLHAQRSIHDLIGEIAAARLAVSKVEQVLAPLEEIFIKVVRERTPSYAPSASEFIDIPTRDGPA